MLKKLPKPTVKSFGKPPWMSWGAPAVALENQKGDLFLGVNSEAGPEEFQLYRWQENGDWELIFSTPGRLYSTVQPGALPNRDHFNDNDGQCLVFLIFVEKATRHIVTVSYDGLELSRVEDPPYYRLMDRFPNGDLLFSYLSKQGCIVRKASADGTCLWEYRREENSIPLYLIPTEMKALPDGSVLLWDMAENHGHYDCFLHRLDRDGQPIQESELSALRWNSYPLPEVKKTDDGWVVEDCREERSEPANFATPYLFRRVMFTPDWHIQETRQATMKLPGLFQHTFYPDGVLVGWQSFKSKEDGTLPLISYCKAAFLSFSAGEARRVLTTEGMTPQLGDPSFYIPLFRREDGSYVFSIDYPNANAKAVLLAADPSGEILWIKKYRCEGRRWVFLRGDKLVAVWCNYDSVTAETYRLP